MNLWLFLSVISSFLSVMHGTPCDQCSSQVIQPSEVVKYCQPPLKLTSNHRCCLNSTVDNITDTDIVGIDLRNCSLHNVTGIFKNMTSVVIISLEENPMDAVNEEDFYHLTELQTLTLPGKIENCPGGELAWNISIHTPDNSTDNSTLQCEIQLDTCGNEENNGTCPTPQSYCAPAGPGLVDCLCSPDYHGYKCLRKGNFPMIPFVAGICSSTVVSAVFLWVTQRRFVKKST